MQQFAHKSLSNAHSEIRVLTLEKGEWGDPLRGALSAKGLADSKPFEALSYCWGSPQKPCNIHIQTESQYSALAITENLHWALRRLRSSSRERRIWADGICIDQDIHAKDEKAQQVAQMGDIYSSAEAVQIYLGEQDDDSQEAFDLMDRIVRAHQSTTIHDTRSARQWIEDNNLPSPAEPYGWQALKDFYRRPWFRRKWIIQETIVSPNAIISCGNWEKEFWSWFEPIEHAISRYGLAIVDHTTYKDAESSMQLQQGLAQVNEMIRVKNLWRRNVKVPLMELLYRFQTARAFDRHDHLFALLSLADPNSQPGYARDYRSSIADVVERYANFFVHEQQNLQVLYLAGLHGHQLLAPSWIPNWYGTQEGFSFEYAEGPWSYGCRQRMPNFCNAAPGAKLDLLPSSARILGLRGCHVDSIVELATSHLNSSSQACNTKDSRLLFIRRHAQASEAIMKNLSSYPTGEDLEEVCWRTMICNVSTDLTRPPNDFADSYRAWRRTYQWPPLPLGSPEWQRAKPFSNALGRYNSDKIFGRTKNGYVGMFPRTSKPEDKIYLLFGGDWPFVLRHLEREGSFQLVGQCYIHGIMEGQINWRSHVSEAVYLGGPYDNEGDAVEPKSN